MQKRFFESEEIYHIYNSGINEKVIFNDSQDYSEFLNSLSEFNRAKESNKEKNDSMNKVIFKDKKVTFFKKEKFQNLKDSPLVDILAFCLMPNHFHLLLRQRVEGGISKFMQVITAKHSTMLDSKEKGLEILFRGRFKAVHVDKREYLNYLIFYIHFNPLALIDRGRFCNNDLILNFLNDYKWSSHMDYLCVNKLSDNLLVNNKFLYENFKDSKEYKEKLYEWLEKIEKKNKNKLFAMKAIDCEA